MKILLTVGLAAAVATSAAIGCATAQTPSYQPAPPLYDRPTDRMPQSRFDQYRGHESGTLGRLDQGADPRHPEGPGNAQVPR